MLSTFLNSFLVLFTLSTASGLLLHDTRLDKVTSVAMAAPVLSGYETGAKFLQNADLHTHVERGGFSQTMNALHSSVPGLQPRAHEDKKHLLQRHTPKGHHPFDNYNLPLV